MKRLLVHQASAGASIATLQPAIRNSRGIRAGATYSTPIVAISTVVWVGGEDLHCAWGARKVN